MLAGEVSSTRKKQEFVIQSTSATTNGFSLYYKGSINVNWGDGSTTYLYSNNNQTSRVFSHTYSTAYSGDIKIKGNVNLIRRIGISYPNGTTQSQIQKLSSLDQFDNGLSTGDWSFDINNLPSGLTRFYNVGLNTTYGTISNLPIGLTYCVIGGSNTISGDISNFFGTLLPNGNIGPNTKLPNLKTLEVDGQNQLSGDLSSLSRGISFIQGAPSLTYFNIGGNNTITGDIANFIFNIDLHTIILGGNNTVYGDLSSISNNVDTIQIYGKNTITGDIASLSQYGITGVPFKSFNIRGYNTTYGDIYQLPPSLTYYYNSGSNTVTGDIQYIPSGVTGFYSLGLCTVYGDISTLNTNINSFYVTGYNTITGDISHLSSLINLNVFTISGKSTVYGDIQYLPPSIDSFTITSNGIISGTISVLNTPTLKTFSIGATNSITGNISDLPSTVNYLQIYKNLNKLTYTGRTWSENMMRVNLQPLIGNGLTTTEVDLLLNDLANVNTWSSTNGGHYVYLAGHNEARTSASNTAVTRLISKGVSVFYNI